MERILLSNFRQSEMWAKGLFTLTGDQPYGIINLV